MDNNDNNGTREEKDHLKSVRIEEPYHEKNEKLIKDWMDECLVASAAHEKAGKRFKKNSLYLLIPSLAFSVTALTITGIDGIDDSSKNIIMKIGLGVSSLVGGLQGLLHYSDKSKSHLDFSGKYASLYREMTAEMTREPRYRVPSDVFIAQMKSAMTHLSDNAPQL